MLAIVARSAMDSCATPGPKNSTNCPTTPICLKCLVTVRTKSREKIQIKGHSQTTLYQRGFIKCNS